MKILEKPVTFLREVRQELGKVSWATREELVGSTTVVITITFILAIFIGVVDLALTKGLRVLFQ